MATDLRILVTTRLAGESVQNLDLFTSAWQECQELQTQPEQTWVGNSLSALSGFSRFELAAFWGYELVGGLVLAHDPWDPHVGPCMSVFAQYVKPEFRLKGISPRLMRESYRIAKEARVPVLAFTHRKGPWRYETLYRRIHEVRKD